VQHRPSDAKTATTTVTMPTTATTEGLVVKTDF
jgi:hypothetical protein